MQWDFNTYGSLELVEGKLAFAVERGRLKMTHIDDVTNGSASVHGEALVVEEAPLEADEYLPEVLDSDLGTDPTE